MFKLFKNRGVEVLLSEKQDGNMKLQSLDFEETREKFLTKNGLSYDNLVSAKLEHGNKIKVVHDLGGRYVDYCDGLITKNPEIVLSITSADCLPIFLFDPDKKAIGVLHCGWKSLAKGLIENCLEKMRVEFGSDARKILVGIGPGIQKCHFEIEHDLLMRFTGYEEFASGDGEKIFFDLTGVARQKFIDVGVREENIEIDSRCTVCDNNLWSYRRDGKSRDGDIQAMMAVIKMN